METYIFVLETKIKFILKFIIVGTFINNLKKIHIRIMQSKDLDLFNKIAEYILLL